MKSPLPFVVLTLSLLLHAQADDWTLSSQKDDVTIYSRVRTGSSIKEFKAVGSVDAKPEAVRDVLDDVPAYTRFMPYVVECSILKREGDSFISYQRISPPLCSSRDYTLRVRHETKTTPAGATYISRWELANALGPPEKPGVVRVTVDEGSWRLEPAGHNKTLAIYQIYTDSGGALPSFIANKANQVGIGKMFAAIRKEAAK